MNKKNIFKRNSGFIVGCILAGGASFATANVLLSDTIPGMRSGTEPQEVQTGNTKTAVLESESPARTTFETDPFTVTASGSVINGVESEAPQSETKQPETTGESDLPDGILSEGDTGYTGDGSNGSYSSGEWVDSGTDWADYDSWSGDSGYYNDGYYDDGYYSGDSGNSYDSPIDIYDPGNGNYSYDDGSGSGGGSESGSGNEGSGGNSGNEGSGGGSATTPSDVIVQGISSRYLDVSELYSYNSDELRLIRNEIFALHGRIFASQDLADYFSQRSWYVPTYSPDDFDENMFDYLNDYEQANLQLILDYEAWLGGY